MLAFRTLCSPHKINLVLQSFSYRAQFLIHFLSLSLRHRCVHRSTCRGLLRSDHLLLLAWYRVPIARELLLLLLLCLSSSSALPAHFFVFRTFSSSALLFFCSNCSYQISIIVHSFSFFCFIATFCGLLLDVSFLFPFLPLSPSLSLSWFIFSDSLCSTFTNLSFKKLYCLFFFLFTSNCFFFFFCFTVLPKLLPFLPASRFSFVSCRSSIFGWTRDTLGSSHLIVLIFCSNRYTVCIFVNQVIKRFFLPISVFVYLL